MHTAETNPEKCEKERTLKRVQSRGSEGWIEKNEEGGGGGGGIISRSCRCPGQKEHEKRENGEREFQRKERDNERYGNPLPPLAGSPYRSLGGNPGCSVPFWATIGFASESLF